MTPSPAEPQFSVALPVRNGADYIASAIASVLKQTYQHFNLLILDNCSEDGTLDIVESFQDSRIAVFPAATSLNIEDNWARILDLEMNEYLTILSHDDLLYPDYLQEMAALIAAEPGASLYHAHLHIINPDGSLRRDGLPVPYKQTADEFLRRAHSFSEDLVGSGYVMRTVDYQRIGGFPTLPNLLFADVLCWYRLTQLSYKVCSPRYLYAFRIHPHSTGRLSALPAFRAAGHAYLEALAEGGHFHSEDDHQLARRFVTKFFKSRYHTYLYDVMASDAPDRLQQYHATKQRVLAAAPGQQDFPVFSLPVRLHEALALIPVRPLRILLMRLMKSALSGKGKVLLAARQLRGGS